MPWRTECNWSIWQWPECSCVPESRNQSRYTFVLRVIARQCWVSWKLPLVGGIQRFILNTTFRWVLKLTPLITLIITIQIEIWFVFSLKSSIYFSTCEPEISEFISGTDAVGYNLKRVNYHLYYNKNTIHSSYLFMRFILNQETASHFYAVWNISIVVIGIHFAICEVRSDNSNPVMWIFIQLYYSSFLKRFRGTLSGYIALHKSNRLEALCAKAFFSSFAKYSEKPLLCSIFQ